MDAERPITDRRKKLFAAAAACLGVVAFLVLLEVGLRLFSPAWLEQRMRELNAGEPYEAGSDQKWPTILQGGRFRQFVPGATFMVRHYEYEHAASIDEWGGRAVPHPAAPRALVPFLGDSFTFGLGVPDAETFVALIGARSAHRLLNLGVTGSGLHEQLDIVEMRHEELGRPAFYGFVVFMGNDLEDVRRHYEPASEVSWMWRANTFVFHHPLLKRLYAIQYLRQPVLKVIHRGRAGHMQPVFLAMRTDLDYLEDSLSYFRNELERLAEMSEALDFRYVLVLLPDVHQIDPHRLAGKAAAFGVQAGALDPGRLTSAITAALEELEIPHVDISSCLTRFEIGDLYYVQDTHLTPAGHAQAAECILQNEWMRSVLLGTAPPGHETDASPPDGAR